MGKLRMGRREEERKEERKRGQKKTERKGGKERGKRGRDDRRKKGREDRKEDRKERREREGEGGRGGEREAEQVNIIKYVHESHNQTCSWLYISKLQIKLILTNPAISESKQNLQLQVDNDQLITHRAIFLSL